MLHKLHESRQMPLLFYLGTYGHRYVYMHVCSKACSKVCSRYVYTYIRVYECTNVRMYVWMDG
jgi:hypothetical protein